MYHNEQIDDDWDDSKIEFRFSGGGIVPRTRYTYIYIYNSNNTYVVVVSVVMSVMEFRMVKCVRRRVVFG